MNGSTLVKIDSFRAQLSTFEKEKWHEEYWTAQIAGKPNYKDFFTVTPDKMARSIVRLFQGWFKASESLKDDMLLLVNLDALLGDFIGYIASKNAEAGSILADDEECRAELRGFLSVKCLEQKLDEEGRGRTSFISNFARVSMGKREFLKENRSFLHESFNACVKGVRENPDRIGELRESDLSRLLPLFEEIIDGKLSNLFTRLPMLDGDEKRLYALEA